MTNPSKSLRPTSGLDSTSSLQIINSLSSLVDVLLPQLSEMRVSLETTLFSH